MVNLLGIITGTRIEYISLSKDFDLNDLLGQYVQNGQCELFFSIVSEIKINLKAIASILLQRSNSIVFEDICDFFVAAQEILQHHFLDTKSIDFLQLRHTLLKFLDKMHKLNASQQFSNIIALIDNFCAQCEKTDTKFVWKDSQLITAMKNGYWVILDGVDKANTAVMDRLNPLLENNGTLAVIESGHLKHLTPHKDFRIVSIAEFSSRVSEPFLNRCLHIKLKEYPHFRTLYKHLKSYLNGQQSFTLNVIQKLNFSKKFFSDMMNSVERYFY